MMNSKFSRSCGKIIINILFLYPIVTNAQLLNFFEKIKEALPSPGTGLIGNVGVINNAKSSELENFQTRFFENPKSQIVNAILTKYGDAGFQCQRVSVPNYQPSEIISCGKRNSYNELLAFKYSINDSDAKRTAVRLETNSEFFVERVTLSHLKEIEDYIIASEKTNFIPIDAGKPPPPASFINAEQKNIETRRFNVSEDILKKAIYEYFIGDRKCMSYQGGYRCYRKSFIFGTTDNTQKPISYIFEFQSQNEYTDLRIRIFDGDLREDSNDVFLAILNKLKK